MKRNPRPAIPKARKPRKAKLACPTEHEEQVMLFRWAKLSSGRHLELQLLASVPNGGHLARVTIRGRSVPLAAKRLLAEGMARGFPDTILPTGRGGFFGLFIEMKRREGSVTSAEQLWWHARLRARGYRVEVCRGWEAARDVLLEYLALPATRVEAVKKAEVACG